MNTLFFFFFGLFLPFCWLDSIPHLHFGLFLSFGPFLHLHSGVGVGVGGGGGGGGGAAFTVLLAERLTVVLPLVRNTEAGSVPSLAEGATRSLSRAFVTLPLLSGISSV